MDDLEVLATDNPVLVLRRLRLEDAPAMFSLIDAHRPHLEQYGEDTSQKYQTLHDVQESIVHPPNAQRMRFGLWADDMFVGAINLTPDEETPHLGFIGYWLGQPFTGRGYMGAAVRSLTDWALHHSYVQVWATVHPQNTPSLNVLFKAGYSLISTAPDLVTLCKTDQD